MSRFRRQNGPKSCDEKPTLRDNIALAQHAFDHFGVAFLRFLPGRIMDRFVALIGAKNHRLEQQRGWPEMVVIDAEKDGADAHVALHGVCDLPVGAPEPLRPR